MHSQALKGPWLNPPQRLWNGHLEDKNLTSLQGLFWDAVARLNDAGLLGLCGGGYTGSLCKKPADIHRIGGVVGALVNHFQAVIGSNHGSRHLNTPCSPSIR